MQLSDFLMKEQGLLVLLASSCLFVPFSRKRDRFAARASLGVPAALLLHWAAAACLGVSEVALYLLGTLLAGVLVYLCFDCGAVNTVFAVTCAYAVQHIGSKATYMIYMAALTSHQMKAFEVLGLLALMTALPCLLVYWFFTRRMVKDAQLMFDNVMTIVLAGLFLFAAIYLSYVLESHFDTTSPDYLEDYLTLGAFCILFATVVLLLELTNCNVKRLESENEALERLLERDRLDYEQAKRDMEKINIRYHDLKQQYTHATALERDELEAEMQSLRPRYLTGNKALDVLLSQKTAVCEEARIQLVCSVDGSCLDGMRSYHVYSLFGNAIDNAIECLSSVDVSRRQIIVDVRPRAGMAVIRVENYTPAEPVVRDGGLVTSKEDAANHGFGVKSIQNIAETYGGSAQFFVQDETFYLVVAIPLAALAEKAA